MRNHRGAWRRCCKRKLHEGLLRGHECRGGLEKGGVLCSHECGGLRNCDALTLLCRHLCGAWFSSPLAHAGQLIILPPTTGFDVCAEPGYACCPLPTAVTTRGEAFALPVCGTDRRSTVFHTAPCAIGSHR